jgi:hypothetical protein
MSLSLAMTFVVLLDGSPVGSHRYEVRDEGGERRVTSSARFEVKRLGITFYRYAHDAVEAWRGDCLTQLASLTDDGGERLKVGPLAPPGCVMSFAYWNPQILKQKELLNAQTGRLEKVSITALGDGHYRIAGPKQPIDLWYGADGQWLALESRVAGGRRLRYELMR